MNNAEAVNWLINIIADIGKAEHKDLWHYEQALTEIKEMLEYPEPCEDAVSREALRKAMHHRAFETDGDTMWQSGYWVRYRAVEQVIKESPSVTPKQKTGKWIIKDDTERFIAQCNCCRYIEDSRRIKNYCPNCGADMRGDTYE